MFYSAPLDLEAAHSILKGFSSLKRGGEEPQDRDRIQQALLLAASQSDYQILGVCADSLEQGLGALSGYAKALGYSPNLNLEPVEGSVYIKFNPNGRSYASPYGGEHRGVLVSCQSAEETDVNEMYGHLPLDLFDRPI